MLYGKRYHRCRCEEYLLSGHRLIVLENELLRVAVVASKGADIIELRYKRSDLDVLWHAPQPLLPPGQQIPTIASRRGSFLDHYSGGWQEAFPSGGAPSEYLGAEYGVHGEVSLLPWDVRVICDTPDRIEIEFCVETLRSPFRLIRKMSLTSGSPVLQIFESVTNLGDEKVHFMWGHHPAFAPPFLDARCRIDLPRCMWSVGQHSDQLARRFKANTASTYPYPVEFRDSLEPFDAVQGKESRTEDALLFSEMEKGWCVVRSPQQRLAVSLVWDKDVFPYMWCWQSYGGRWGYPYYGRAYVLAIEPFTCPILPFSECVAKGIAPALGAGERIETQLDAAIFEADSKVLDAGFGGAIVFAT
jgi:galactose mutarotase-like enzyme